LEQIITELVDFYPEILEKYEPVTDVKRLPLKERLHDRKLLLETISTDVRSCGVLVTDLSQNSAFKFAHKSFLELLLAVAEVSKIIEAPDEKVKIINKAIRRLSSGQSDISLTSMLVFRILAPELLRFGGEVLNIWMRRKAKSQDHNKIIQSAVDSGLPLKRIRILAPYFRERGRKVLGSTMLVAALYLHILLLARFPFSIYGITDVFLQQAGGRALGLRATTMNRSTSERTGP
jgi:hypothetical protein